MRYRLDELGWFQFEDLVIALLKADLGMGLESWSTHAGDRGRDAYSEGPLAFPAGSSVDGPFIFQVKFSNAIDRQAAVQTAVAREAQRIVIRRKAKKWNDPTHYCLITNVVLTPETRAKIKASLLAVLPKTEIHQLGGKDVCASLDRHPQIRRSFPQLLGLTDLVALIDEAVSRDVRERSQSAIGIANQYVKTFLPTRAYEKAWVVLREHSFAVLCGPPEMGKTTIAWMVAITQVASNWEAIYCKNPEDFFRSYSVERQQIFVSDDAFGRTEYDPAMVLEWEKQLHLIFPKLDARHWLVWTSRKHLLERARQKMDLQGSAAKFPSPGSVLIEAHTLTNREKALILYRHARNRLDSAADREVIKLNASTIVEHRAFTPERIRSLVDWLPTTHASTLTPEALKQQIVEIIENPTERMRKAYGALDPAHKWILVALLEERYFQATRADLKRRYESHCPASDRQEFGPIVDQLVDAFLVQVGPDKDGEYHYSWIHPSYRDLVIDELSSDHLMRKTFLATGDLAGMKLAMSSLGGSVGARRVPLLQDEKDWQIFSGRLNELVGENAQSVAVSLLDQITDSIELERRPDIKRKLLDALSSLCEFVRRHWDDNATLLSATALQSYAKASRWLDKIPPLPDVATSWKYHFSNCQNRAESAADGEWFDPDKLSDFVEFADAVRITEPRWLAKIRFPESFGPFFAKLEVAMRLELDSDPDLDDDDEISSRASELDELSGSLGGLLELAPDYQSSLKDLIGRLAAKAARLREQLPFEEDEDSEDYQSRSTDDFDIRTIFSDL